MRTDWHIVKRLGAAAALILSMVSTVGLAGDNPVVGTIAPNKSPVDGREGVRVLVWEKVK